MSFSAADLAVRGTLPAALSGRFVRIGEGTVHAVDLTPGRSPLYRERSIAADAAKVIAFGSSTYVLSDGELAQELGPGLDALRRVDLAGAGRNLTSCAKVDPFTGELHLLTSTPSPAQLHVSVSSGGLRRTIRSIDNAPSRIHEFELTRDCVVLLADGFVGVTDRTGPADAIWFAIDTDARGIASVLAHGETVVVHATGRSLVRWTLHRREAALQSHVLDVLPQTHATTNRQALDAANRFLWTVGADAAHKHDLITGTRRNHNFDGRRRPGEFIFIADPERRSTEDGGWLAGFVHDETRQKADFVVLDAQEIERPSVAVVHIARQVPVNTRSAWIPAASV